MLDLAVNYSSPQALVALQDRLGFYSSRDFRSHEI